MPRIQTFPADNLHGRGIIQGASSDVTVRDARKIKADRRRYIHRNKNGVYDPMTFWHILDTLLDVVPGEIFRAADFVALLRESRNQLVWDSVTVGRVITDLAESLSEANGRPSIHAIRHWNGMMYSVDPEREARTAMKNLLEDLTLLCDTEIEAELAGTAPKRLESPLIRCPSVMRI